MSSPAVNIENAAAAPAAVKAKVRTDVSGQPLPLISKGGISVLVTSMAFGIMLSCARHAVRTTDTKAELRQEIEMLPEEARSANPAEIVR